MSAPPSHYDRLARLYDVMYTPATGHDRPAQAAWVDSRRKARGLPAAILDLACGTGAHLAAFAALGYSLRGADASEGMLAVARARVPEAELWRDTFEGFEATPPSPLITCFFNSLAYQVGPAALGRALANIRRQMTPGGLLAFDLLCVDAPRPVRQVKTYEDDDLWFSRSFVGRPEGEAFLSEMVYVIAEGDQVEVLRESSRRGWFSVEAVARALEEAGLELLESGPGYLGQESGLVCFLAGRPRTG